MVGRGARGGAGDDWGWPVKPFLDWCKKNWFIVACGAVVLATIPTAYFFSDTWNKKIKTTQSEKSNKLLASITSADVVYSVPSPVPGGQAVELKHAPNRVLNDRFKAIKGELSKSIDDVAKRAEAFNRGVGPDAEAAGRTEHKPLVDGLFPGPSEASVRAELEASGGDAFKALAPEKQAEQIKERLREMLEPKLREMEDALLGKRGRPDPYAAFLASINAGMPPAPDRVNDMLADLRRRERERVLAGSARQTTPEEDAEITRRLTQARLGTYQAESRRFSVYADARSLPASGGGWRGVASASAFKENPELVNPKNLFLYQWDLWILNDLGAAIRLVNAADARPTDVERSVVKRVAQIAIAEPTTLAPATDSMGMTPVPPAPAAAPVPGTPPPLDMSVSITGRASSPANDVYDVRKAELTVVVSSKDLPRLIDAISRANTMTVIGVQLDEVKTPEDLAYGFWYGEQHVVKARLTVETVWLRSWMRGFMPRDLRDAIGAPALEGEAPAAPAQPAAPAGPSMG